MVFLVVCKDVGYIGRLFVVVNLNVNKEICIPPDGICFFVLFGLLGSKKSKQRVRKINVLASSPPGFLSI